MALRQQLFDIRQDLQQIEDEIINVKRTLNTLTAQNRKQREVLRQLQKDIAGIERSIGTKQAQIDKLKEELEPIKEQTRKQTDMLAQIKTAWEKAEAEAQALEKTVLNNQNGGS